MKLTRRQLRKIILREFKIIGSDGDYGLNNGDLGLFGGNPPPKDPGDSGRGGGGERKTCQDEMGRRLQGQIHQLIRVNLDPKKEFEKDSYRAVSITGNAECLRAFNDMCKIYNKLDDETRVALYSMTPGRVSEKDSDAVYELLDRYITVVNVIKETLPELNEIDYEYFTVYHPHYASPSPEGQNEALKLYANVTGYLPNPKLLEDFERILHCASAMFG